MKNAAASSSSSSPLLLLTDTATSSSNWILVFGFGNQKQCDEVLRKFRSIGTVTDVKMSSGINKNWVAVQYDSRLALEKAASEKEYQLSDGCFCGVKKLPDAQSFFLEQQRIYSIVLSNNLLNGSGNDNSSSDGTLQLFGAPLTADGANSTNNNNTFTEINEADILMGNTGKQPARGKSCCESFFAFIYGW